MDVSIFCKIFVRMRVQKRHSYASPFFVSTALMLPLKYIFIYKTCMKCFPFCATLGRIWFRTWVHVFIIIIYTYIYYRFILRCTTYGSFHGRFTVNIFFPTKYFFLPSYFENNRHVFFFSMWYLKISRYNFFKFGSRENFFFLTAHCKSSFEYKM